MDDKVLYKDLSYKIVGLAMEVHRELGPGFLEKVYENSLKILFAENGISAVSHQAQNAELPARNRTPTRVATELRKDEPRTRPLRPVRLHNLCNSC